MRRALVCGAGVDFGGASVGDGGVARGGGEGGGCGGGARGAGVRWAKHAAELARLTAAEAAAREKRVVDLMALAGRRLKQLGLSRGWLTWVALWEAQSHQRRVLRAAAGRMMKPKLSMCFMEWRQSWTASERQAAEVSERAASQQRVLEKHAEKGGRWSGCRARRRRRRRHCQHGYGRRRRLAAELQQAVAAQDEAVQRALAEQAAAHTAELARAGARRMRWALPLRLRSHASPSSPLKLPHACVPHAVPDIALHDPVRRQDCAICACSRSGPWHPECAWDA